MNTKSKIDIFILKCSTQKALEKLMNDSKIDMRPFLRYIVIYFDDHNLLKAMQNDAYQLRKFE